MGSDVSSAVKKVAKPINNLAVKPVSRVIKEAAKAPKVIVEAPKKIVGEVGKAGGAVISSPKNLLEGSGRVVANVAGSVGTGAGNLIGNTLTGSATGLGNIANALLPAAQKLLNPNEFIDRKQDFAQPPIITTQAPQASSFDFSSLIPVMLIGGAGILIFMLIKKRK